MHFQNKLSLAVQYIFSFFPRVMQIPKNVSVSVSLYPDRGGESNLMIQKPSEKIYLFISISALDTPGVAAVAVWGLSARSHRARRKSDDFRTYRQSTRGNICQIWSESCAVADRECVCVLMTSSAIAPLFSCSCQSGGVEHAEIVSFVWSPHQTQCGEGLEGFSKGFNVWNTL